MAVPDPKSKTPAVVESNDEAAPLEEFWEALRPPPNEDVEDESLQNVRLDEMMERACDVLLKVLALDGGKPNLHNMRLIVRPCSVTDSGEVVDPSFELGIRFQATADANWGGWSTPHKRVEDAFKEVLEGAKRYLTNLAQDDLEKAIQAKEEYEELASRAYSLRHIKQDLLRNNE